MIFIDLHSDTCDVPLGVQDGRVTRSMFTASSMYNHYYGPWCARLQARNHGSTRGGWIAKYNNRKQWLQIDLGAASRVKRIATQGRYDANQWVKSYTVSFSHDGSRFYPYREGRRTRVSTFVTQRARPHSTNRTAHLNWLLLRYNTLSTFSQVFLGNSERYFVVTNRFFRPFKARYVRIHPQTWYGHITMRVELYGCRLGKSQGHLFIYLFVERFITITTVCLPSLLWSTNIALYTRCELSAATRWSGSLESLNTASPSCAAGKSENFWYWTTRQPLDNQTSHTNV